MRTVFRREEWLEPDRYGYGREGTSRVARMCEETDRNWWNVLASRLERRMPMAHRERWVDEIYGSREGACIVAGAGPSLMKRLDFVERMRSRGWGLIAVDRAFTTLCNKGIRPDVTVCCDAQEHVASFLEGFGRGDTATVSVVCHPAVEQRAREGKILWHAPLNPFSPFWNLAYHKFGSRMATLRPGYVVTFSAVDLALWMGYELIVTVGNDLCFESESALRAEVGDQWKSFDAGGGRATHRTFRRAASAFGFFPKMHPDVCFADASEGIVEGWEKIEPEWLQAG